MMRLSCLFPLAAALAAPAAAEDLRDFCGDRPGIGTPPCTVDKGHVLVEVGLADWTLVRQADSRIDTILGGDFDVRIGLTDSTEARVGWTPYGHVRTRDRLTGRVDRRSGIGDVTIGIKQNVMQPDGDGFSVALLPYATLPVGREPIGAGDWGGGLIVPVSYELTKGVKLALTPEVDAAVDEDGDGRHLAYGSVVGLSGELTDNVTVTGELEELRDRDPSGHETQELAGLSIAWQPQKQTQLDLGSNIGLNHASPDLELYFGVSRKF